MLPFHELPPLSTSLSLPLRLPGPLFPSHKASICFYMHSNALFPPSLQFSFILIIVFKWATKFQTFLQAEDKVKGQTRKEKNAIKDKKNHANGSEKPQILLLMTSGIGQRQGFASLAGCVVSQAGGISVELHSRCQGKAQENLCFFFAFPFFKGTLGANMETQGALWHIKNSYKSIKILTV